MSKEIIITRDLTKKYGDFAAVDRLNLKVKRGEVFGLLGPNGAGKTTTILMLLGLTEPTSGEISVLDLDPVTQPLSVKARVGYMPDAMGFYDELTARENLIYIAKLNNLRGKVASQRINESLERVGLMGVSEKRVGTFSRGMRQRLGVADVLVKEPELIIMDEPTQGLDPEGAHEFIDMIRSLKHEDITILLSSHLLMQVQEVCDRVGLFSHGQMLLEGSVADLAQRVLGGAYRVSLEGEGDPGAILASLNRLEGAQQVRHVDGQTYQFESTRDLRPEAAAAVIKAGGRLFNLEVAEQSLDDIYSHFFKEVENAQA